MSREGSRQLKDQSVYIMPKGKHLMGAAPRTRFDEFDDATHPCNIWWEEHGQYMMSGGGRREFIWACRGWIAREQLAEGVEVTGDSLNESKSDAPTSPSQGTPKPDERINIQTLDTRVVDRLSDALEDAKATP
jgi:hypothetical protein